MSFFKSKQVQVTVREQPLNFNVISKGELENLKYYGKVTAEQGATDPSLYITASNEMMELLLSKVIAKEGEDTLTVSDINDLCNDEIQDIIVTVTGSSETLKKALNK
ncbi:MAG: hypothetical protein SGJ02_11710 [bacterium]|nr:hypothetical protein [bacterium]